MTLFGVGATADNTSNGGTTLGRIGFGYVNPDFNASFRYTTPSYNGTTLSVGIYAPKAGLFILSIFPSNRREDESNAPVFPELTTALSSLSLRSGIDFISEDSGLFLNNLVGESESIISSSAFKAA